MQTTACGFSIAQCYASLTSVKNKDKMKKLSAAQFFRVLYFTQYFNRNFLISKKYKFFS